MLPLGAFRRLTETHRKPLKALERLLYDYDEGKIMVVLAKLLLEPRSASGAELCEGWQPEVKPRYKKGVCQP